MAIYKRATRKLIDAGITDIVITKRLRGATPQSIIALEQSSTCFKTADEAVSAVLSGFRPTITKFRR